MTDSQKTKLILDTFDQLKKGFDFLVPLVEELKARPDPERDVAEITESTEEALERQQIEEKLGFPIGMATEEEVEQARLLVGSSSNKVDSDEAIDAFESENKLRKSIMGDLEQADNDAELSTEESDELMQYIGSQRNSTNGMLFPEKVDVDEYIGNLSMSVSTMFNPKESIDLDQLEEVLQGWISDKLFPNPDHEVDAYEWNTDYALNKMTFTIPALNHRNVVILARYIGNLRDDADIGSLAFLDEYYFRKEFVDPDNNTVVLVYVTEDGSVLMPRLENDWRPELFEGTDSNLLGRVHVKDTFNYVDARFSSAHERQGFEIYKGSFDESKNDLPLGTGKDLNYYKQKGISSSLLRNFDGTTESLMAYVLKEEDWVRGRAMTLGRYGEDVVCAVPTKGNYFEIPETYKISENEVAMLRFYVSKFNEGRLNDSQIIDEFLKLGLYKKKFKPDTLLNKFKEHKGIIAELRRNPNLDMISVNDAIKMKKTVSDHVESQRTIKYAKVGTQQVPYFANYEGYIVKGLPDIMWRNKKVLKINDVKVSLLQHLDAKSVVEKKDYHFQLAFYAFLAELNGVKFDKLELSNTVINFTKGEIEEVKMKQWQLHDQLARIKMKLNMLINVLNDNPQLASMFK